MTEISFRKRDVSDKHILMGYRAAKQMSDKDFFDHFNRTFLSSGYEEGIIFKHGVYGLKASATYEFEDSDIFFAAFYILYRDVITNKHHYNLDQLLPFLQKKHTFNEMPPLINNMPQLNSEEIINYILCSFIAKELSDRNPVLYNQFRKLYFDKRYSFVDDIAQLYKENKDDEESRNRAKIAYVKLLRLHLETMESIDDKEDKMLTKACLCFLCEYIRDRNAEIEYLADFRVEVYNALVTNANSAMERFNDELYEPDRVFELTKRFLSQGKIHPKKDSNPPKMALSTQDIEPLVEYINFYDSDIYEQYISNMASGLADYLGCAKEDIGQTIVERSGTEMAQYIYKTIMLISGISIQDINYTFDYFNKDLKDLIATGINKNLDPSFTLSFNKRITSLSDQEFKDLSPLDIKRFYKTHDFSRSVEYLSEATPIYILSTMVRRWYYMAAQAKVDAVRDSRTDEISRQYEEKISVLQKEIASLKENETKKETIIRENVSSAVKSVEAQLNKEQYKNVKVLKESEKKDEEIKYLKNKVAILEDQIQVLQTFAEKEEEEIEDETDYFPLIRDKNILFVASDIHTLMPNLRRDFPNGSFMDSESRNLPSKMPECVCLFTKHMNHSLYYKVKNAYPSELIVNMNVYNMPQVYRQLYKFLETPD